MIYDHRPPGLIRGFSHGSLEACSGPFTASGLAVLGARGAPPAAARQIGSLKFNPLYAVLVYTTLANPISHKLRVHLADFTAAHLHDDTFRVSWLCSWRPARLLEMCA